MCARVRGRLYFVFVRRSSAHQVIVISCQQLLDFCMDFLDGSLPEEDRRMFQNHLGYCGECEAFFETYKRTPEVSRDVFALKMPVSVKESVRSFLRARYGGG